MSSEQCSRFHHHTKSHSGSTPEVSVWCVMSLALSCITHWKSYSKKNKSISFHNILIGNVTSDDLFNKPMYVTMVLDIFFLQNNQLSYDLMESKRMMSKYEAENQRLNDRMEVGFNTHT